MNKKNMNKSKVYIIMEPERINDSGIPEKIHDLTPAEEFGELVHPAIFPRKIFDIETDDLLTIAKKKLDKITENDYILLIGDPVAIGIVGVVIGELGLDKVNLLRWNPRVREYNAAMFNMNNRNNDHGQSIEQRAGNIKRNFSNRRR